MPSFTVLMFKNVLWKVPLKQNQNWQEANDDELAVYKPGCGAELETIRPRKLHVFRKRKSLILESRIEEILLVESRILDFGI